MNKPLDTYRNVGLRASVETASPHQLITMLLQGALEAIAKSVGAIERKNIEERTKQINKATGIVLELRACLDEDKGGEIAANLANLYTYITQLLFQANRANDPQKLEEAKTLLLEILEGWAEIPPEYQQQAV